MKITAMHWALQNPTPFLQRFWGPLRSAPTLQNRHPLRDALPLIEGDRCHQIDCMHRGSLSARRGLANQFDSKCPCGH